VWFISLRDLVFRRRRFAIAVVGTAAVFAMALVLAGMASGFRVEAERTLKGIGADSWVLPAGVPGPWTSFRTMPETLASQVATEPGVAKADPLVHIRQSVHAGSTLVDVNIFGHVIGGLGEPVPAEGHIETGLGQAVVDGKLGYGVGDRIVIGRWHFRVVGVVHGMTAMGGVPTVWMTIQDAQTMGFDGQPLATAIVTKGVPRALPKGLISLSNATAADDSMRPMQSGIQSINSSRTFLWIIAAIIIAAVVYLSALERVRDFAVLKATGASSRSLFLGLAAQAVLVAFFSALLAAGLAQLLAPLFPLTIAIPLSAYALLPVVAFVVGLLASLAGLRRAVTVDPALAFGGGN
jgi:putative ABC transport system permease protein